MNGAESLVATAVDAGLSVCFSNPGTTEMPLVQALDDVAGLRSVLGLFEGVVTGAADGYARIAGEPALTLLHLGPGLGNGIANLHNARRARTPVVNVIGDQATYHRPYDAPLTSDIASLAAPVSGWVRSTASSTDLAADTAAAISAARAGQGATLIVPSDCQWGEAAGAAQVPPTDAAPRVGEDAVEQAAKALRSGEPTTLMLGGGALTERGLRLAGRVASATGCELLIESFPARMERGAGLPNPAKLPYFPEQVLETLRGVAHLVLVGARSPVAFFAYPDAPSELVPEGTTAHQLATAEQDLLDALARLAERVGADGDDRTAQPTGRVDLPTGPLDPAKLGAVLAALQPEDAIVVDEATTSGMGYGRLAGRCPRHTVLTQTGGAIGMGLPAALGASVAAPDRPVVAFQADGSAMYTVQALWTMAREQSDVTVVLCDNAVYRILQVELHRAGVAEPGPGARSLTDLSNPAIGWTGLAESLGVPATRAETAEELAAQLRGAVAEPGPHLIDAVLPSR